MKNLNFLELILWFHSRIIATAYLNAENLARRVDPLLRTSQRTIAHFRDRVQAPVATAC